MQLKKRIIYFVAIAIKTLDGALEFVAGIITLFLPIAWLQSLTFWITAKELTEDHNDFIALSLRHITASLNASEYHLISLYLISHGVIKLIIVISLLQQKIFLKFVGLILYSTLIIVEIWRLSYDYSSSLAGFIALDLIILTIFILDIIRKKKLTSSAF